MRRSRKIFIGLLVIAVLAGLASCGGGGGGVGTSGGVDVTAPSAPAGLMVSAPSTSQINLSWAPSTDDVGVTGYKIYRDGLYLRTVAAVISTTDTGLAAGTPYCYAVAAVDGAGNESTKSTQECATTQAPDVQAPTVPSGLAAVADSSSQISLSWNASTDDVGVTGYNVYHAGGYFIETVTGTSTTFTGLAAGTQYCYKVSAVDAAGNESGLSVQACATTDTPPPLIPAVPSGLAATVVSSSSISLSWTDASNDETGFKIERSITAGAGYTQIGVVGANVTSYTSTGLAASTTYYYRVRAYNAAGDSGYSNTAAAVTPAAWQPITISGAPTGRTDYTALWTGSEMIVWGGTDGSYSYPNAGAGYDPAGDSWTSTSVAGAVPSGRRNHTAVWTGTKMIVWGGYNTTSGRLDTGGVYDPAGDSWAATSVGQYTPAGREGHTAVWTGSTMIVWGGSDAVQYFNSGASYNPSVGGWVPTTVNANTPAGRAYHTGVWTGSVMIVWGGYSAGSVVLNTGGRYSPYSSSWTAVSTTNAPSARYRHTAVWTGTKMIVWGGWNGASVLNTGGIYDSVADTWTAINTTGAPSARAGHTAVWTGSKMIVWGGYDSAGSLNTGGIYDPVADTWTAINTTGAPSARNGHTAVWTGAQKMIVWGGVGGAGYVNTGGIFLEGQ